MRKVMFAVVVLAMAMAGLGCGKSSSNSVKSYCDFVKQNKDALSGDSLDGAGDLKELAKRVDDALDVMNSSASKAPSAIRGDIDKVIVAIGDLQKVIKAADGDEKKLDAEKAQKILENESTVKANESLQKYNKDNCGVDTS